MRVFLLSILLGLTSCSPAVGRSLSLCALGFGAEKAGKGTLSGSRQLTSGEARTFATQDPIIGSGGDVVFTPELTRELTGYDGGAMVLVSWTTGSGTNDVGGQGLFWEIAPNAYRNSAAYAGYSSEDGGTIGTVSEQEIRSELLRGAGATSLESCNSP